MAKQAQRRPAQQQKTAAAPVRRSETKRTNVFSADSRDIIFGRQNFILMGAGIVLVLLGLLAMAGGGMPDPDTWEPERIYSFRRITLAPMLMILGFVVVIFGIFKKNAAATPEIQTTDASEA